MAQSQTPARRPRPEDFMTAAEWRWARRDWIRRRGGALWPSLAIATFFALASGSQLILLGLIVFAVAAHMVARSRP